MRQKGVVTVAASQPAQRVPTSLTRFFGRSVETEAVTTLLRESRLLTLVGAPGSGKTRLGVELGAVLRSTFDDGVGFVDLAAVTDGESVPAAVALALGIAQEPGSTATDTVTEKLATADLLIILDNCEHLVRAVASVVHCLLRGCTNVRVLTTSRVGLGVAGEQLFRVPPLDPESAIALFADRACLVQPAFVLDDDRGTVEGICRRLDGLPLAIELAAAWNRVLSPSQILHRLDTVLPMLTSADTVPSRHRTMEATVAWSYHLLTPAQQVLLDQLSVFVGGFDLTAAESVTGPADRLLDDLTALVDHSLVLADQRASGMRYRLPEPIREYGEAILARRADEFERARVQHVDHYLGVARRGDVGLRRADRSSHLLDMRREEGNLLAALVWARDNDREKGLRLATALAYFLEQRGAVNDGRAWLTELLDGGVGDRRLRGAALARLGRLAWRQRDNDEARLRYTESLTIARELDDPLAIARGLRNLALVECGAGNTGLATGLCERSLQLYADLGDERGRGWTWTVLGLAKFADRQWQEGTWCCQQAFDANREQRSAALEATAHLGVAFAAANTNDTVTHRRHLAAVLADMRDVVDVVDDPDWLWAASGLAVNEGRARGALKLAGAARAVNRRGSQMADTFMVFSEAAVRRARREVGARTAERIMAEGAAMTMEQLMVEALAPPTDADRPLSPREREVAELVGDGLTNEQIATRLFLSRRTVESHVEQLKRKLDLGGRNEVIAWALRGRIEGERA